MMIFAFTGFTMAQTIENFESLKMNIMLGGAEDLSSFEVVPNPDQTGINKSLNCVKFLRDKDGVLWDGFYATLANAVDLTENKYVHVKVWKPRISTVMFKLEGTANTEIEPVEPQTLTNTWEELVFDFSALDGPYSKIVFTPDRVDPTTLTEDAIIYFDEIMINNDPNPGSAPVQIMEDYETIPLNLMLNGANDQSMMTLVANPDPTDLNPSSYVMKFDRDKDGFTYDGFWSALPTAIDVTTNKFVHVKVWKSRISPIKFKIEGGAAGTVEIASKYPQTKTEEWEDIVFDFSAKTGTYPTIGFFPDFADPVNLKDDITMYFDDIILNNDPKPMGPAQQIINVDMSGSGMSSNSQVWLSGALGGIYGSWAQPGTVPANEMFDPDGDGIYSITLQLPDGVIAFKFFWGTGWSNGDNSIADRTYTVNGNADLNFVWSVPGYTENTLVSQIGDASFKVFPNPTEGMITVQSSGMKGLTIRNVLGETLKSYKLQSVTSKEIDLSSYISGVYFISVETSHGTYTSKLMKN